MRYRLGTMVAATAAALMAPSAHAAPLDVDPTFGTGGFALAGPADAVQAVGAPIVQPDGKVVVVGRRRGTDAVVVERFTAAGQPDASFGAGGEVVTDLVGAAGRVAVADAGGGAFHVVAPTSASSSKIALYRFTAAGAVASKATGNVPGSVSRPAAAVARPDGSTYVSLNFDCGAGVQCFGVAKFKGTGLDATFGGQGYVKVKIGSASEPAAIGVVTGTDGKDRVAVAGSSGPDTALARFLSTGALDPSFDGDGIRTVDLSGSGAPDAATGLVTEAGGGLTVSGTAGATGYVARFTSTGATDTSFNGTGVRRSGLAPASAAATAIAGDGSGRYLVALRTTDAATSTSKWAVTRLNGDGSVDAARVFDRCANTVAGGPSGIVLAATRIHVAGSCTDSRIAAARLFQRDALRTDVTATVTPGSEAAGHERVRLSQVDPTSVLTALNLVTAPIGSGPIGSGPIGSGPIGSGPIGSGPLDAAPIGSGPIGSGPIGSGPIGSGPIGSGEINGQLLLSDVPLVNGSSWTTLLAPYFPDGGVPPLQTLTLQDAYRIAPGVVDGLRYADLDLSRTPLARATLAGALLTRPLQFVDPPSGGWCAFLAGQPFNCSTGVDLAKTTLFELEYRGDRLRDYYAQPLSLAKPATDLGTGTQRALLAYVPLKLVDLGNTPFGAVPASALGGLLNCGSTCTGTLADRQAADPTGFSTATLGDLVAKLPLAGLPDVTLGQLLPGLVNPANIPYERADGGEILKSADLRSSDLQTYTATFEVDCTQAAGLQLVPRLADDARIVPGSGRMVAGSSTTTLRDPAGGAGFDLAPGCVSGLASSRVHVSFQAEPGSQLGPKGASLLVTNGGEQRSDAVDVAVDDSRDPGNGAGASQALGTKELVHGWISDARDVDFYSFPAPAPGTRVSLTLSQLPADYDLTVYGPVSDVDNTTLHAGPIGSGPIGSGPIGSGPIGSGPIGSGPLLNGVVPDSTNDATDPAVVEPDRVQDFPIGSGPIGSGPVGMSSINRGRTDEAVTFRVRRADAGGTITVRVSGYNGANDAKPYLLRRVDTKGSPLPACPARTSLSAGAPGQWPASVPAGTKALYLVNRQRLAALNSTDAASDVMAKLQAVADRTDGLVVPVESAPGAGTGAAYAAWDADPCNEDKANGVVEAINAAVDTLRERGDGLKELRSITLVGPDAVVPQARLRDETVLSNEDEYANEAQPGASDDAVSGSLRDGYLLTDDPYGDFNAAKAMYVPDVALGRLVETAPEIGAQLQRFVDADGKVTPEDARVLGYDFFSDGSAEEAAALGTTARLDSWDEGAALAAYNRPTAGFTAVNAHYDAYRALPAAAFNGDGSPNLLYARDVSPQPGSVLFTMGCHSGLNLAGLEDWAQLLGRHDALWTGSTTFSYGDTEAVAYTERILAGMAAGLGGRQVTVGQALMYAKQRSLAEVGVLDAYYVKASQGLTFYGLPMYRIGGTGGTGASGMPPLSAATEGTRTSDPLSLSLPASRLHEVRTDRGSYWQVDDQEPLVVQGHPVQPVVTKDVTSADGRAKGFLIEALKTDEVAADPVIARPTVDLEAHEPEPVVRDPYFPATLATVTTEATPSGLKDRLVLAAGQYRGDRQRLFRSIDGRVLRSSSTDNVPVTIRRVDGAVSGGNFTIRVETDGGDAIGGNVLYRTAADTDPSTGITTWRRAGLAPVGGGVLATGGALPAGTTRIEEAFVQVVDAGNQVALSDYKVLGYSFVKVQQGADTPKVVFTPDIPGGGYATKVPAISLDTTGHDSATYQYRLDGGAWTDYAPGTTFSVPEPADGHHLVEFRGSDGSTAVRELAVDRTGPVLTGEADRVANANGWYDGPVTVSWTCADAVSGVVNCPAPQSLGAEGKGQSVTASATDRAGNAGSGTFGPVDIDLTDPGITADVAGTKGDNGWYTSDVTVAFTCSDLLSGIDSCTADKTLGEGRAQTVTGKAVDRAGRTATKDVTVDVDKTAPAVAITSPNLLIGTPTSGTASDATSGVAGVSVTFVPTLGGATVTKQATVTCQPNGTCTWSVANPALGVYDVTATATDRAGLTKASPTKQITITVG